jgi:putative peptidoglycan lipid II flippase
VWLTLAAYPLGQVPTGASRLLQNGLFARGDTAGPAKVALVRVLFAGGLGLVLMFQFEQLTLTVSAATDITDLGGGDVIEVDGDLPAPLAPLPSDERTDEQAPARLGVVGLALGSAAGAWVEYALLRRYLRRRVGPPPSLRAAVVRLAPAAGAAALAMVAVGALTGEAATVLASPAVLLAGGGAYLAVAYLMRIDEVRALGVRRP